MSRIIFRQIYDKIQEIEVLIVNDELSENELDTLKTQLTKLKFVSKELYNADYIKQKHARERLQYYIDSNFSYDDTAIKYNTEINVVHTAISRYNKSAIDFLGKEAIENLLNGEIDKGFLQANNGNNNVYFNSLILKQVHDLLPRKELNHALKVTDCTQELALFKLLSINYLRKQIQKRNKNKLSFLLYILMTNDSQYRVERELMYKYLEGSMNSFEDTEKEMTMNEFQSYLVELGL